MLATGGTRERDLANAANLDVPGKVMVSSESLAELSRELGSLRLLLSMKFHGTVVATMQGVPSISLMPTSKSVRYLKALGRPELVSHFAKESLLDLVETLPDPIDPSITRQLRAESVRALQQLRERLVADQ